MEGVVDITTGQQKEQSVIYYEIPLGPCKGDVEHVSLILTHHVDSRPLVHLFEDSDNLLLGDMCVQVSPILVRFWPVEVSITPVLRLISESFIVVLCECIKVLLFFKTGDIDKNLVDVHKRKRTSIRHLLILCISENEQLTITNTIGNRHAQFKTMKACIVGLFVCMY